MAREFVAQRRQAQDVIRRTAIDRRDFIEQLQRAIVPARNAARMRGFYGDMAAYQLVDLFDDRAAAKARARRKRFEFLEKLRNADMLAPQYGKSVHKEHFPGAFVD